MGEVGPVVPVYYYCDFPREWQVELAANTSDTRASTTG